MSLTTSAVGYPSDSWVFCYFLQVSTTTTTSLLLLLLLLMMMIFLRA